MVWQTLNEGQNSSKSHNNRCPCLSLKWVLKSTLKTQFWESWKKCIVSTLAWATLNEGQNSSKSHKNRCPFLSLKSVPKSTFKFHFWKSQQSAYFQLLFDHSCRRAKIALNLIKISVHAYLWNGYLNLLQNLNLKKWEICNVLGLHLTKFDGGPKWLAIPKKSTCRDYLSNGYLNTVSKFQFRESQEKCIS